MTDPGLASLAETIELQRAGCELAGSALYAELLRAVAADVAGGGACRELLLPFAAAPMGDAVLLRLLAGVHGLVLEGRAPGLAAHYPSVGGTPHEGAADRFLAAVEEHRAPLGAAMERGVQTNEVGRSAALLCGFLRVAAPGLPLRVLEVGSSAGLNLRFDRYHYRSGAWAFGPPESPLRFDDPYVGDPPALPPSLRVAERRGCDLDPIDPTDPAGARRLRSYVWADQLDRLGRLDAALEIATAHPVAVDRAGAVAWLRSQLADPVEGVVTVVTHSIMFQYLSATDRTALLALLDAAGARATPSAPVAWLRMEPGGDRADVRLTTWPGGGTTRVARSSYHGPPVVPG